MKLSLKTVFYFLTIIMTASISEGATAKMKAYKLDLPKTVGVWTRPDSPRLVDSTIIFKYMNGAGELYLAYSFNHIDVYEYSADNQDISAEIPESCIILYLKQLFNQCFFKSVLLSPGEWV